MRTTKNLTKHWWAVVLRGVLALGLGLVFIVWPGKSLLTVVVLAGMFMLIDGIITSILGLLSIKKDTHWWVMLLQGIFGIFLGLVLFNWPQITVGLLFFLLAIWFIFSGAMTMILAIAMRRESYGNWTVTAIGILGILFGIVMFSYPTQTLQVVVVILGIFTLISGIMGIALGLDLRRIGKDLERA